MDTGCDKRQHLGTVLAGCDHRPRARHREARHVDREQPNQFQIAVDGTPVTRQGGTA
jgi:hypothetical protein